MVTVVFKGITLTSLLMHVYGMFSLGTHPDD